MSVANQVTVVSTPNNVSPEWAKVIENRTALAQVHGVKYGLTKAYAVSLFEVLPVEWYLVEHNSLLEEDKPVLAEGKAFREALKAAGHKNPSVEWTRVRKEARIHAEGEAERGANAKRTIDLRFIEELTRLYKAGKAEESLNDKTRQALIHVSSALTAMGVDLAMLVTK